MNSEEVKIIEQQKYFKIFLNELGLSEQCQSIRDGDATIAEPDIICEFTDGSVIGFELTECMIQELRRDLAIHTTTNDQPKTGGGIGNIRRIVAQKLDKRYTTKFPVELLVYSDQFSTINYSGAKHELLDQGGFDRGQFEKIWLMFVGEETGLIYDRSAERC